VTGIYPLAAFFEVARYGLGAPLDEHQAVRKNTAAREECQGNLLRISNFSKLLINKMFYYCSKPELSGWELGISASSC
jgi:hypothetical protein